MDIKPSIHLQEPEDLLPILEGLVQVSLGQLRRGLCPPLYQAGVRYVREAPGRENWQTAVQTFRLKSGDCEDLSIYLAASKRLVGIHARCVIVFTDGTIGLTDADADRERRTADRQDAGATVLAGRVMASDIFTDIRCRVGS